MRTKFFAIAALVLGLASCQKDFAPEANSAAEVDFQLSVSAPELGVTRAGDAADKPQNGKDSAYGAVDYFQGAGWDGADLRYTLEVYDYRADGNYAGQTPVKDRMAIVLDAYDAATFELRLAPKRDYHFVVFADFVKDGAAATWTESEKLTEAGLNHRIGATLADIELINEELNDEAADAYFATRKINPSNNTANKDAVTLTRPYAKVRVVATDLHELNLNVEPASVVVTYEDFNANAFNAVEGTIAGKYETKEFRSDYADAKSEYTEGYDAKTTTTVKGVTRYTHKTLFTDYILATDSQKSIQFDMLVIDQKGNPIKYTNFNTEIPVQRNHLTTIIGNVLTTAVDVDVTIDDNFENADYQNWVFEAFVNGGEVTLDQDYTIGSTLFVEPGADVVLNLNGHTIKNTKNNQLTDVIVVKEGGKLTINGNGYVKAVSGNDGYAVISEGELVINGGTFQSGRDAQGKANATIYARGNGKVYINDGIFNTPGNDNDGGFVLNKKDADRETTVIEVRGGKFCKFDPYNNAAEGPGTNFCANGFWTIEEGNYFVVVPLVQYKLFVDHAEVYTAEGLLQWAYIVENGPISAFDGLAGFDAGTFNKYAYGLEIMANINMPAKTIVADPTKETYVFTNDDITVTDGVPSGSNWIPVCTHPEQDGNDIIHVYTGWVDGMNKTISGLRVNTTSKYAGLIGFMYDGVVVKDLTFSDAVIKGANSVGVVAGRAQDDTLIENVRVVNSKVSGATNVGSIVGYNYSRVGGAQDQGYSEGPAIVRNCSNGVSTVVICSGSYAGGIVGYNYGATIANCKNYADVTGSSNVGGIVGYTRDYHHNKDGYIVACATYPEATITAKNGCVGGIAGYTLADNQHTNTYMHIVACASLSELVGNTKGAIIGYIHHGQHTAGCVAVKNGATKLYGSGKPTTEEHIVDAILYDAANGATQADVDALNAAIAHYNGLTPPAEAQCNFTWELVNGFPVLK